jgi:hypothetical protein
VLDQRETVEQRTPLLICHVGVGENHRHSSDLPSNSIVIGGGRPSASPKPRETLADLGQEQEIGKRQEHLIRFCREGFLQASRPDQARSISGWSHIVGSAN